MGEFGAALWAKHGRDEPESALHIDAPNSPMAQIGTIPLLLIAQLSKEASENAERWDSGVGSKPEKQKRFANGEPSIHKLAGCTGLEPATSDVTGRRSNQLS